mgnify:CR=1 FL=1
MHRGRLAAGSLLLLAGGGCWPPSFDDRCREDADCDEGLSCENRTWWQSDSGDDTDWSTCTVACETRDDCKRLNWCWAGIPGGFCAEDGYCARSGCLD